MYIPHTHKKKQLLDEERCQQRDKVDYNIRGRGFVADWMFFIIIISRAALNIYYILSI